MLDENDLLRRVSVYNMLANLGGVDATDNWSRGWDRAIDSAIEKLDSVQPVNERDSENIKFKINNDLIKIAKYHGFDKQVNQLIEEMSELSVALNHYRRCSTSSVETYNNIVEEIADVEIMLSQIKYLLKIYDHDMYTYKKYKIHRQIENIKITNLD